MNYYYIIGIVVRFGSIAPQVRPTATQGSVLADSHSTIYELFIQFSLTFGKIIVISF